MSLNCVLICLMVAVFGFMALTILTACAVFISTIVCSTNLLTCDHEFYRRLFDQLYPTEKDR